MNKTLLALGIGLALGPAQAGLISIAGGRLPVEPPEPPAGVPQYITDATAGQWTAIGTNTMEDEKFDFGTVSVPSCPASGGYTTNFAGLINAWSGGVYDSSRHRLFVTGGGHNDYDGNEWYAFDMVGNEWERVNDPTLLCEEDYPSHIYPDGTPGPSHSYGYLGYDPTTDLLWRLGSGGEGPDDMTSFNPDTLVYNYISGTSGFGASDDSAFWNPTANQFVLVYKDMGAWARPNTFTPSTGVQSAAGNQIVTKAGSGAFSDERQEVIFKTEGASNLYAVWDLTGGTSDVTAVATTGAPSLQPSAQQSAHGFAWDSVRNRWVVWNGGKTLSYLNPTTFVWTTETPAGGATPSVEVVGSGGSAGIWGRFQYIEEYDVYIGYARITDGMYMFKPSGWSPP